MIKKELIYKNIQFFLTLKISSTVFLLQLDYLNFVFTLYHFSITFYLIHSNLNTKYSLEQKKNFDLFCLNILFLIIKDFFNFKNIIIMDAVIRQYSILIFFTIFEFIFFLKDLYLITTNE